ncbi:MAG: diguanylate cyclase [Halofilum sp. (in: g-proteobacteria)]|nr:diguanylate cyclase [Halofilum sp. (in: g-proteobacteria)]
MTWSSTVADRRDCYATPDILQYTWQCPLNGEIVITSSTHDFDQLEWLRIFRATVEASFDSILITDADFSAGGPRIIYANPGFTRMTGYTLDEVRGCNPRFMQGPETDRVVIDRLRDNCQNGEVFRGATVNYRKDGTPFDIEWTVAPIRDDAGNITHYMAIQRDVTEREAMRQRLEYLARHDALTALFNRQYTQKLLGQEIERCERHGAALSVLVIDIDHFKRVNDDHGHACGDTILQHVAQMIRDRIRTNDFVGRWGGEEFLVVLPHTTIDGATEAAESLRTQVEQLETDDSPPVTISVGVAEREAGETAESLFEAADMALYAAKDQGRNRVLQAERRGTEA